jgi:hypothetical protein
MSAVNLPYLLPRVARHFLPQRLTRFLLLRSLIISPGLETADPQAAVSRYVEILEARHDSLIGRRVLVFGYGGRFDVGIGLLEAGAGHVVLCEKLTVPDDAHNALLIPKYQNYLRLDHGKPRTRPELITVIQADLRHFRPSAEFPLVDLVISNSVYEHLDDAVGITGALAQLTSPAGLHIHYVDLRDHFFRYPFEMLTYSDNVWRGWLNPTSNHNRLRLWDYRRIFNKYFGNVEIQALQRDEAGFSRTRPRIRQEYISGNVQEDAVTLILILAAQRRKRAEP